MGYEIVATGNFRNRGQKPEDGNFVTSSTSLPTYCQRQVVLFSWFAAYVVEDKPMRFFSLLFLIAKEYLEEEAFDVVIMLEEVVIDDITSTILNCHKNVTTLRDQLHSMTCPRALLNLE